VPIFSMLLLLGLAILASNTANADLQNEGEQQSQAGKTAARIVRPRLRRTTGRRAPQMRTKEKDRMRPILAEIFSCVACISNTNDESP